MDKMLIILSIQGFFITIVVLLVVYYLIKIVAKIALTTVIKQAQDNLKQQQRSANPRREGEVTIETRGKDKSGFDQHQGEYVDFEEID